jgi:hypothetical protein
MKRLVLLIVAVAASMTWSGCTSSPSKSGHEKATTTTSSVGSTSTTTLMGGASSSSTTSTVNSTAHACRSSEIQVALLGSDGAGGTTYTHLTFTNHAPSSCRLADHPGISFLQGSGRVIGEAKPVPSGNAGPTLAPGEVGSAMIGVSSSCLGSGKRVSPATLRIVLPAGDPVSLAADDFAFCPGEITSISAYEKAGR